MPQPSDKTGLLQQDASGQQETNGSPHRMKSSGTGQRISRKDFNCLRHDPGRSTIPCRGHFEDQRSQGRHLPLPRIRQPCDQVIRFLEIQLPEHALRKTTLDTGVVQLMGYRPQGPECHIVGTATITQ